MGFMSWLRGGTVPLVEHQLAGSQLEDLFNALVADQTAGGGGGLGVAAIFRARQIIADTLSSLPVKAGDSLVPAPNRGQDWQTFIAETVLSMQDHGDAYWHVAGGELFVLPAGDMQVKWSEWFGFRRFRRYEFRLRPMRVDGLSKNLHVVSMNRGAADLTGLGWLESSRIRGIIAIDAYSQEYFENNAMPAGMMSVPQEPTKDEAALIKSQWSEAHRTRSLGIKPKTWDYDPMSFSPNDSQWVDSHLVSIGDVSNLSGVPAFLLQYNPPGSTQQYENVEQLLIRLWRETLKSTYAKRIEDALTEVLGFRVEFDPSSLFVTSLVNRSDAASKLVAAGFEPGDVVDAVGLPAMRSVEVPVVEVPNV